MRENPDNPNEIMQLLNIYRMWIEYEPHTATKLITPIIRDHEEWKQYKSDSLSPETLGQIENNVRQVVAYAAIVRQQITQPATSEILSESDQALQQILKADPGNRDALVYRMQTCGSLGAIYLGSNKALADTHLKQAEALADQVISGSNSDDYSKVAEEFKKQIKGIHNKK